MVGSGVTVLLYAAPSLRRQCGWRQRDRLGVTVHLPTTATYNLPHNFTDFFQRDRLVGLVVRRPPRERKIPGSNPACAGIFSGSSHTSDLNIGTPVATHAKRLAL